MEQCRNCRGKVWAIVAVFFLLPAASYGSPINFTFSGGPFPNPPSEVINDAVTIEFNTLVYGTTVDTGVYLEQYTTDSLTVTSESAANGFGNGEVLVSIVETGPNLIGTNTSPSALNLYQNVSNVTLSTTFATDLGLTTTPDLSTVSNGNFSVTGSSGGVTSATAQLTVSGAPEPSSLILSGVAVLIGLIITSRSRRLTKAGF